MIWEMILNRKLLVFTIVALGGLFGLGNSLYVHDDMFYVAVVLESFVIGFLFLSLYVADAIKLERSPSVVCAVLMFLFYPFIFPAYLLVSRGLMRGIFFIIGFVVVIVLHVGFYEGGDYLAEYIRERNLNREMILNIDSSVLNEEKMKSFISYYQKIINDDSTPYILVDSKFRSVVVPTQYADENGYVVLDVSPGALRDLEITDSNIKFRAMFEGVEKNVVVTKESILAIYYMETGEGVTF